jgi:hypothetical protein
LKLLISPGSAPDSAAFGRPPSSRSKAHERRNDPVRLYRFLKLRDNAEESHVRGDGTKVGSIVPHEGSASLHTLAGDTLTGTPAVARYYLRHAYDFRPNGTSRFEIIDKACGGNLGFWTGFQVATVQLGKESRPVQMRLRVT